MKRQVIPMGSNTFTLEVPDTLLQQFILDQSGKSRPKICLIPTAGGDAQSTIDRFYAAFSKHDCVPTHLSLFRGGDPDLEKMILSQDILYVSGGNTRNLITLWKDWGLDRFIRKAYEQGVILTGGSAGSLCWFKEGVTDSVPGSLTALKCFGWLEGSNCPHYDGEVLRRPSYHRLILSGELGGGIATDNGVAAHYIDEKLVGFISSSPTTRAYHVYSPAPQKVEEHMYFPKQLSHEKEFIRRAAWQDAEGIHTAHMKSIQEICAKDYTSEEVQAWGHRPFDEAGRIEHIKNSRSWVIEKEGKIEGWAQITLGHQGVETVARLDALYITRCVLKKGYGRKLVDLMLNEAGSAAIKHIKTASTLTSRGFYKKMGFAEDGPISTHLVRGVPVRHQPMKMDLA